MRHCTGETVTVYEQIGKNFSEVLREVASEAEILDWEDASWFNVTVTSEPGDDGRLEYRATLYVHS